MMRACCVWLLLTLCCVWLPACSCSSNKPPAPLTPDQERQMQKQLDEARSAEGAAQQQEKRQEKQQP